MIHRVMLTLNEIPYLRRILVQEYPKIILYFLYIHYNIMFIYNEII